LCDNNSSIKLSKNYLIYKRTKHIDLDIIYMIF